MRDGLATVYALVAGAFLIAFRLDAMRAHEAELAAHYTCNRTAALEQCLCRGLRACYALGASGLCDGPLVIEPGGRLGRCASLPLPAHGPTALARRSMATGE